MLKTLEHIAQEYLQEEDLLLKGIVDLKKNFVIMNKENTGNYRFCRHQVGVGSTIETLR